MKMRHKRRSLANRYTDVTQPCWAARWVCWRVWINLFNLMRKFQNAMLQCLQPFIPTLPDYGVGDYVTRAGDDVQLVTYMSDDKVSGEYRCVVAPGSAWCSVGDMERNLCNRYQRIEYTPINSKE